MNINEYKGTTNSHMPVGFYKDVFDALHYIIQSERCGMIKTKGSCPPTTLRLAARKRLVNKNKLTSKCMIFFSLWEEIRPNTTVNTI